MPKYSRGRGVPRGRRATRSKYECSDTSYRPIFPEVVMETQTPFQVTDDDIRHLDKVCRLCMVRGGPAMEHIFQNSGTTSIAAQITFVTQIVMRKDEPLPSHVCQQCIFRLNVSQNFKQQCVASDRTLRELYLRKPGGKSNETTSQATRKQNSGSSHTNTLAEQTSPADDNYVLKVEPLSPCSSDNDREEVVSNTETAAADSCKIEIVEHNIDETNESSHGKGTLQTKKTVRGNINKKGAGPFICEDCHRTYPTWDQLRRHRVYHSEKRIPCPECDRKFIRRAQLRRHLLWHSGERPFACPQCDKRFAAQTTLDVHMRSHSGVKLFKCHLCDKTFGHNSTLTTHVRGHLGDRPYQCPSCPLSFTAKSPLNKHIRTHTGYKPHKCPDCPLTFTLAGSLRAHSRTHTGERPFPCPHCDKSFAQPGGLKNHVRIHTGSKPYECKICYKAYRQQGAYSIHMRTHANIRPYSCDICSRTFSVKKTLARHIRVHTGERTFECSVCQQMFAREDGLATHMLIHSDQRPFQCVTCNKGFRQKMALVLHMRCHTGERPFKCAYCEMTFAQKGTMVTHMRIHTGEKPYSCADCSKRFAQLGNLIDHRKRHHPYSDDPKGEEVIRDILERMSKEKGSEEQVNAQDSEESDIGENLYGDGLNKASEKEIHSCQLCSKTFLKLKTLIWHVERFHSYTEEEPQQRKKLKLKKQRTKKGNPIPEQASTTSDNEEVVNPVKNVIKTEVNSETNIDHTHTVCNGTDSLSKAECTPGPPTDIAERMAAVDTDVVSRLVDGESTVGGHTNDTECNSNITPENTDKTIKPRQTDDVECNSNIAPENTDETIAPVQTNDIECNSKIAPENTDKMIEPGQINVVECNIKIAPENTDETIEPGHTNDIECNTKIAPENTDKTIEPGQINVIECNSKIAPENTDKTIEPGQINVIVCNSKIAPENTDETIEPGQTNNIECNSNIAPKNTDNTIEPPTNFISNNNPLDVSSSVATSSHVSAVTSTCGSSSTLFSSTAYQMQFDPHTSPISNEINSDLENCGSCVAAKDIDSVVNSTTCQMLAINNATKSSSVVDIGVIEVEPPSAELFATKLPNLPCSVKENEIGLNASSITTCNKNSVNDLKEVENSAFHNDFLIPNSVENSCVTERSLVSSSDIETIDTVKASGQVISEDGFFETTASTSAYLQA